MPGRVLLVLLLLPLTGCLYRWIQPKPAASLLKHTQMSPDSVALEIVFVRFPVGDAETNGKLWEEVDEQHFPADVRQRLARNGFRAGVIGGQIPATLEKLLEMKEEAPAPGEPQNASIAEMAAQPRVAIRHLQTRGGKRNEVIASGIYERLPLLVSAGGELHGQTYSQAQGLFALTAYPQADGRVRLDLVPEVHHDQARQRFVGDQAMWRLETSRPKQVLDDLKVSAVLTPGTMLLLTTQPDRAGSLGHYFFTEGDKDQRLEQKLLVLRVCQTQHDDLVSPGPLSLQEP